MALLDLGHADELPIGQHVRDDREQRTIAVVHAMRYAAQRGFRRREPPARVTVGVETGQCCATSSGTIPAAGRVRSAQARAGPTPVSATRPPGRNLTPKTHPLPRMSTSKRDVTTPVTTTWPNQHGSKQFHLDLAVDDLDAAAARCVEFGATLPVEQPRESWRVLLDPSGHPFCLTQAANWG